MTLAVTWQRRAARSQVPARQIEPARKLVRSARVHGRCRQLNDDQHRPRPRAIVAQASGSGATSSTTASYSPLAEHIQLRSR